MRILISHLHGDHVFGLPGMLHSLSFMGRTRELEIVGPKGIVEFVTGVNRVVKFYANYDLRIREVKPGMTIRDVDYKIRATAGRHGVPCLAYAFEEDPRPGKFNPEKAKKLGIPEGPLWKKLQSGRGIKLKGRHIASRQLIGPSRKGVKITYAVDTRPCAQVAKLASHSDLLIHDSCFDESAVAKARDYGHSTAGEAARVARKSRSRKLALVHISAMYEDASPLLGQAKAIFPETILTHDMLTLSVRP